MGKFQWLSVCLGTLLGHKLQLSLLTSLARRGRRQVTGRVLANERQHASCMQGQETSNSAPDCGLSLLSIDKGNFQIICSGLSSSRKRKTGHSVALGDFCPFCSLYHVRTMYSRLL